MPSQLISILIPAFNAERWITPCIESALAQTWARKEIIVVDDGSSDSTLRLAQSFESRNVKVVTQENRGASSARNQALVLAQGNYIQWLDADDVLAPDKAARQMESAEAEDNSSVLLSSAWGKFHSDPAKTSFSPDALWESLDPPEWLYRKLDQNLWMAIESWLVSRKLTELAGPWDERLSLDDDGEYFTRVVCAARAIQFCADSRSHVRAGKRGLSSQSTWSASKLPSQFISLSLHIQRLLSMENSPRTRSACLRFLQRWVAHFYPERMDLVRQMQAIAAELGGQLRPELPRGRYRFLQKVFGWRFAKKAQRMMSSLRASALRQ